jgi:uncharacterized protein YnzC (UPF0291/DUF896 family)
MTEDFEAVLEKHKIDRINELAKKKKSHGLSDEELTEQGKLREEYLAKFRESFKDHLDHIEVVDEQGGHLAGKPKANKDKVN